MTPRGLPRGSPLQPLERLLPPLARTLERAEGSAAFAELRRVWIREVLAATARVLLAELGLPVPESAALFRREALAATAGAVSAVGDSFHENLSAAARWLASTPAHEPARGAPERLGSAFESLLGLEIIGSLARPRLTQGSRRKRTGTFYTPGSLTAEVAARALDQLGSRVLDAGAPLRVCDPACGAGAFLLETARQLLARRRAEAMRAGRAFDECAERVELVTHGLAGVDLDPLAVEVAQLALWMFAGAADLPVSLAGHLHSGDALTGPGFSERPSLPDSAGFDWRRAFPDLLACGFELIIGNPPWVAFAGRAAQPLEPRRRAFFGQAYAAFRGYPTLQAVFIERALELAAKGVVALVVPSPIADLDGYRATRRVVRKTHTVCEPLLEFGQDAFADVMQPCFALLACSGADAAPALDAGRGFRLEERSTKRSEARSVEPPRVFARLSVLEKLPAQAFGEMGLQTTRVVSEQLLLRAAAPDARHTYPLLEGREVREYHVGPPRLFLRPDLELLRAAGCRLRPEQDYRKVEFVVRQTARTPIAALHTGLPFRNTLLAGFGSRELPAALLVGLLNSSLYRALHLAAQRDARQAVFPQVKVGHLRALPLPPPDENDSCLRLCALVRSATQAGSTPELRRHMDELVFSWFGLASSEREEVLAFLRERAPEAGRAPVGSAAGQGE